MAFATDVSFSAWFYAPTTARRAKCDPVKKKKKNQGNSIAIILRRKGRRTLLLSKQPSVPTSASLCGKAVDQEMQVNLYIFDLYDISSPKPGSFPLSLLSLRYYTYLFLIRTAVVAYDKSFTRMTCKQILINKRTMTRHIGMCKRNIEHNSQRYHFR